MHSTALRETTLGAIFSGIVRQNFNSTISLNSLMPCPLGPCQRGAGRLPIRFTPFCPIGRLSKSFQLVSSCGVECFFSLPYIPHVIWNCPKSAEMCAIPCHGTTYSVNSEFTHFSNSNGTRICFNIMFIIIIIYFLFKPFSTCSCPCLWPRR